MTNLFMKTLTQLSFGVIGLVLLFSACREKPHEFEQERIIPNDTLPNVLGENRSDLIEMRLRGRAMLKNTVLQLPETPEEWKDHKDRLRENIIKKSGVQVDHHLDLDLRVTKTIKQKGYTIQNLYFQTRPGMYATANLFIPDGDGPFPGVVNMHGHWSEGKLAENVQARGHTLALNGYVCLSIDAFGSGERSTVHGEYEYHGSNLGASLMNIGETLLGMQVSDNMRAVDLLLSLPYVDKENIGATGASGGGNQTMWFGALDERVKAAMPIVSVGTFESAVMRSNCVCELLPDGLTFTETSGVLALYAPRALKMCNHHRDSNPTFYPVEMQRSYSDAKRIFEMLGAEENFKYELFDLTHGYWPEDREAMLGWFDLHLKNQGDGSSKKEIPFEILPPEELMVFEHGQRDPLVTTIEDYCRQRGGELRKSFLDKSGFDKTRIRTDLREILKVNEITKVLDFHDFGKKNGWDRIALETQTGHLIPILHLPSASPARGYVLIAHTQGKQAISPDVWKAAAEEEGKGIVIVDLSGTGEVTSATDQAVKITPFHTLARAHFWMGETLMGEWAKEIGTVSDFIRENYDVDNISFDGSGEVGLAGLFLNAMGDKKFEEVTLREIPISYQFDNREHVDSFSLGIHLPGLLEWGDISLAAALSEGKVNIVKPLSMSGLEIDPSSLQAFKDEFAHVKKRLNNGGEIFFYE